MKRPAHIVKNSYNGYHKWINLLTNETYRDDAALEVYLATYVPLPVWYTWESWQKRKNERLHTA